VWPLGAPDVAKLDARGDIEGLVRAAGRKKDPAVSEAARAALEERMDFFVDNLDSKNIRRLALSRDALRLVGEPAVVKLVDVYENGDVGRRRDAAYTLGVVGLPSALPTLKKALRDRDETVRVLALRSLGKIDDERVVPLVESALRDRDDAVRAKAAAVLKKLRKQNLKGT
jgi:HEAT repeat protein